MGTTYSNCQVRCHSQEAVVAALTKLLKEPAYIGPAVNGWVGVYPEGYSDAAETLAKKLSAKLSCGVFFWSVYDSDIFFYTLYEDGKKRDEFDSSPDYFDSVSAAKKAGLRGKPEALLPYCLPGIASLQVREVLHPPLLSEEEVADASGESLLSDATLQTFARLMNKTLEEMKGGIAQKRLEKYTFAEEQATDLTRLIGMDERLTALGYRYIEDGEADDYAHGKFLLVTPASNSIKITSRVPKATISPQRVDTYLNQRDSWGEPYLVKAARFCLPEPVREFLNGGDDVNGTTNEVSFEAGISALIAAAGASIEDPTQQFETVRLLLEAGADVNARSSTGRTALGEALKMTDPAQHQGKIGRRAPEEVLQQAAARSEQIVEMLRAAGATE